MMLNEEQRIELEDFIHIALLNLEKVELILLNLGECFSAPKNENSVKNFAENFYSNKLMYEILQDYVLLLKNQFKEAEKHTK